MPSNDSHPSPVVYRFEHEIICHIVEEGCKVLDLGCGEGDLLKLLGDRRKVQGTGVEVSEQKVYECIHKGLSVHHGDIDEGLSDYPDKSFDYVILSETLQEVHKPRLVIKDMLRVGKKGIVSFPNFGFWKGRLQLLFLGRSPMTQTLPFDWYETPNIHFFTIKDFFHFCERERVQVVQSVFIYKGREITLLPNLLADSALFILGG